MIPLTLPNLFQLWLLHTAWNELDRERKQKKKQKNSRHPFIVSTGKSADRTKHLLGFIPLIYSCQLSGWWRGVRLKVAGGVALFLSILLFYYNYFLFFFILETSAANTRLLMVIIARFNKAITVEKWQTFISSRTSALQCHGGRFFKMWDLIKAMARQVEVSS